MKKYFCLLLSLTFTLNACAMAPESSAVSFAKRSKALLAELSPDTPVTVAGALLTKIASQEGFELSDAKTNLHNLLKSGAITSLEARQGLKLISKIERGEVDFNRLSLQQALAQSADGVQLAFLGADDFLIFWIFIGVMSSAVSTMYVLLPELKKSRERQLIEEKQRKDYCAWQDERTLKIKAVRDYCFPSN